MKKAVLRGFIFILIAALLICSVLSAAIFGMKQTDAKQDEMIRIVRMVAEQFDPEQDQNTQARAFAAMLDGIRVTIIDMDGNVTGDSAVDYQIMENHSDRAEIMEARGTKIAVSVRQSSTIGKKLMYAVIRTPDGYYIRLAEEYGGMVTGLVSFLPAVLLAALLSLIIAFVLANKFSNSVTGPILAMNNSLIGVKDGSVTLEPDEYPYDELQDMADKINALAADISLHIGKLQEEKDKIAFILDNMKEGFILLDDKQNVLLINNSACTNLQCNKGAIGQSILHCTQNLDFLQTVDAAMRGHQNKVIDINADGRVIETEFAVVDDQSGIGKGLIVTMTDVTEKRNAVKMRRDFFSNASHELKTPITSIKGSTELLCADVPLEDEQRKELLARIGLETDRMYSLINDIIMINRIESGEVTGEKDTIDLASIVRECCGEAAPFAEQSGLSITMDLESAAIHANYKNVYEMVSNLIMNAVKYNRPNGNLDVSLKNRNNEIVFTVRNDGEPIPPEHHHRVFERFYRVDKGRSKTVGGTGLGLSIVKHVVDSLGGVIRLESDREKGTIFTVKFPK